MRVLAWVPHSNRLRTKLGRGSAPPQAERTHWRRRNSNCPISGNVATYSAWTDMLLPNSEQTISTSKFSSTQTMQSDIYFKPSILLFSLNRESRVIHSEVVVIVKVEMSVATLQNITRPASKHSSTTLLLSFIPQHFLQGSLLARNKSTWETRLMGATSMICKRGKEEGWSFLSTEAIRMCPE